MRHNDLEARIQRLEDIHEIANLQGRYNHYVMSHRYQLIVDMFAKKDPDISAELGDSGVLKGYEGIYTAFMVILKEKYMYPGILALHNLMTPVIEVAPDGKTARGMWHSLGCNTTLRGPDGQLTALWQAGRYDQEFVKEDGEWKFRKFRWYLTFRTPYDQGWVKVPVYDKLRRDDVTGDVGSAGRNPYDPGTINPFYPLPPDPRRTSTYDVFRAPDSARLVLDHELQGVTAEMIDWWWDNMGPIEHYRQWHPEDHLSFEWEISPAENGHIGAIQEVKEYIGGHLEKLRIRWEDPRSTRIPTVYSHVLVGSALAPDNSPMSQVVHEYEDVSGGVRFRTTFVFPPDVPGDFLEALRKHSEAEAQNFPKFLPELYRSRSGAQ